jgi:cytidine deaminase
MRSHEPPNVARRGSRASVALSARELSAAAAVKLSAAAAAARAAAYAPYSKYAVGAAILDADGSTARGCNVENASYGLTICAERTALFAAVAAGARAPVAIAVSTEDGGSPCGACRQALREFVAPPADRRFVVVIADARGRVLRRATLAELLPDAFGPGNLAVDGRR